MLFESAPAESEHAAQIRNAMAGIVRAAPAIPGRQLLDLAEVVAAESLHAYRSGLYARGPLDETAQRLDAAAIKQIELASSKRPSNQQEAA